MSNVIRRFSVFSSVFHRVFRNFLKNGKFCWKLQELEEMHKKSTIYCFLLFHWLTLFRLFFFVFYSDFIFNQNIDHNNNVFITN